jgi:hypothetical protein
MNDESNEDLFHAEVKRVSHSRRRDFLQHILNDINIHANKRRSQIELSDLSRAYLHRFSQARAHRDVLEISDFSDVKGLSMLNVEVDVVLTIECWVICLGLPVHYAVEWHPHSLVRFFVFNVEVNYFIFAFALYGV